MESAKFESSLITELNRVLFQAAEEVESEERLDLAYEVLETVRFEQSHISWLDRLRSTTGQIEFRLNHAQLPTATGRVRHLADPFIVLDGLTSQYLVNCDLVSGVVGLSELSQSHSAPDVVNSLDNVWFHDLVDHRLPGIWYLVGDQVIEGCCLRTGFDALDIESGSKIFTVPKRAIVACRTGKQI